MDLCAAPTKLVSCTGNLRQRVSATSEAGGETLRISGWHAPALPVRDGRTHRAVRDCRDRSHASAGSVSTTKSSAAPEAPSGRRARDRAAAPARPVDCRANVFPIAQAHLLRYAHRWRNRIGASGARCNSNAHATTRSARADERDHKAVALTLLDRPHPPWVASRSPTLAVERSDRRRSSPPVGSPTTASSPRRSSQQRHRSRLAARPRPTHSSSPAACPHVDQFRSC